jgi:hypothetical protein
MAWPVAALILSLVAAVMVSPLWLLVAAASALALRDKRERS